MISKWHVTTIGAIVAIVLVIVILRTTDDTVTETEIVISPTSSIEEQYEKYINALVAKTVKEFEGLYPDTHSHPHSNPSSNPPSTEVSKYSENNQEYSLHTQKSDDYNFDIEAELDALESEYLSLLSDVAEMMEDIRERVESMSIEVEI